MCLVPAEDVAVHHQLSHSSKMLVTWRQNSIRTVRLQILNFSKSSSKLRVVLFDSEMPSLASRGKVNRGSLPEGKDSYACEPIRPHTRATALHISLPNSIM